MNHSLRPALAGTLVAILVTTAMDASGFSMLSALPLIVLTGTFWGLQKLSSLEMALGWGDFRSYTWAVSYPLAVLGVSAAIAVFFGAVDTSDADWRTAFLNIGLGSGIGVLMVMLTEEGFFRGWLWASLKRAGRSEREVLVMTSLAFALWHVSAVSLDTGFDLPGSEIPIYLINVIILGSIWGILRMISGSVLVPAVSHAVWNGIAYPLFGFGESVGALGISETQLFGPEVGVAGIVLNSTFLILIWTNMRQKSHNISQRIH